MSVTREKLYDEIWAEPIIKVSKRYEVSDSYLVRILKNLNIPRPPRGYWAMVAAGIHPEKPPLPAAKLGDAITWSRDGQTEFATSTADETKTPRSKRTAHISTHGLVREAREHFNNVRDSSSPYLKPYKKIPRPRAWAALIAIVKRRSSCLRGDAGLCRCAKYPLTDTFS